MTTYAILIILDYPCLDPPRRSNRVRRPTLKALGASLLSTMTFATHCKPYLSYLIHRKTCQLNLIWFASLPSPPAKKAESEDTMTLKQASSDSARPNGLHPSHGEGNSWPHSSWSLSPCSLFLNRRSRQQASTSCLVHELQTSFRSHGVKTQVMTMCRRPSTKGRHQLIW